MVMSSFMCGIFPEEKDEKPWKSLPSTPRKTSPRSSSCKKTTSFCNRDSKNPYSNCGLDKFSALLAQHEEKRQKIYSQFDPKDVSLVRFTYSNENDCIPIVVKSKDKKRAVQKKKTERICVESSPIVDKEMMNESRKETDLKKSCTTSTCRRRACFILPVAVALILMLLVVFGRSFAIMCISVGWYILPTIATSSNPTEKKKKKKEDNYVRSYISENKLSSPKAKSNNCWGSVKNNKSSSHLKHGHQQSLG